MGVESRLGIDRKKYFQIVLISFLAIQLVSWVISSVSDVPILKGGPMFFLFLIVILFTTVYSLGKNLSTISIKKDGLVILLVFVTIIILFLILPVIVPEIFSTSGMEFGEYIKGLTTAVMELSPGGIVPR